MNKYRFVGYGVAATVIVTLILPLTAQCESKIDGARVFKENCASCHLGGGNRVKEKRQVAGSKQLASITTFKTFLTAPTGHMPSFPGLIKDGETIKALYEYCKKLPAKPIKSASAQDLDQF